MKKYIKPTLSIVELQPKETIADLSTMKKYNKGNETYCNLNWTYYDLSSPNSGGSFNN